MNQKYALETLENQDFTLTENDGTAGENQTVAQHRVPRGEARMLPRYPGRLTFGAKDTFDGDGATTTFALSYDIVQNSRGFGTEEPAVLSIGGVEKVYTSGAPGAGEFTIDYAANTVTTGDTAGAGSDNVVVYYPFSPGSWTVEVFAPNERRHETFANGTIRALNVRPQDDVNSPFQVNQDTPFLPQDVLLRIQVDSTAIVNWDDDNPFSQIELPFHRKPLSQMTQDEIAKAHAVLGA